MLYFHSFWTVPITGPERDSQTGLIEIWEFEVLVWLLSALEIRRHSRIRLITDSRGLQYVQRTGLDWVYNGGITTVLDEIPKSIDPQLFWAAGKIYAWKDITEPAVSVDTDAIIWKALQPTLPAGGLHFESNGWPWYASNELAFKGFGFEGTRWDWSVPPLNHGVLYIQDTKLAQMFVEHASRFMISYSHHLRERSDRGEAEPEHKNDAMLFADQRLLAMCAKSLGLSVEGLTTLNTRTFCVGRDGPCVHLWISKVFYRYCAEARIALCNYLIEYILESYPESRPTLSGWGLDKPMALDRCMQLDYRELTAGDHRRERIGLLTELNGPINIRDSNFNVLRRASAGSLILPGEDIIPEDEATFKLVSAGTGNTSQEWPGQTGTNLWEMT